MKTPKASGALRWAPDPMPRYACFTHPTPLHYIGKIGRAPPGVPPFHQILGPLLKMCKTDSGGLLVSRILLNN